jgi:hypothetical protein
MIYSKTLTLFFLTLLLYSCSTSKEALDQSIIKHGIRNADAIRELAEFAVINTFEKKQKSFQTDTLQDKAIRKKFNSNGYGGLITVTFKNSDNNIMSGLIDSTVIFKQITLQGVTEIIYDFAADKKKFKNDKTNSQQFVFLNITDRIYYRRRPVPLM